MSSAVNKSSTRFAPKVANRGSGRQSDRRRPSTIRASFSVPSQESSDAESRPKLDTPSAAEESAIEDEETPDSVLATSPASLGTTTMPAPSSRVSGRLSTIDGPVLPQLKVQSTRSRLPGPVVPAGFATPPSTLQDQDPEVETETPTKSNERETGRRLRRQPQGRPELPKASKISKDEPEAEVETDSAEAEGLSQGEPEIEALRRDRVYDEQGREVMNPEDLPQMGRGRSVSAVVMPDKAINVMTFTMATLCQDIPIGEVNEDYTQYEDARMSRKRKRARILKAKQMMRGQYNPKRPELRMELEAVYQEYRDEREERFGKVKEDSRDRLQAMDAEQMGPRPTMQLQLTKDGEIQLDAQSQTLDRHAHNRAELTTTAAKEVDRYSAVINSYSFSSKERQERWTEDETNKFYQALSVWGTDFSLISHMFENRSRHQIKTKFKFEEKRNPDKVQMYLVHRRRVDVHEYAKVSGKEILEVKALEEDLDRVREEHQKQLKVEMASRQQALAEDAARQLASSRSRPRAVKRERRL